MLRSVACLTIRHLSRVPLSTGVISKPVTDISALSRNFSTLLQISNAAGQRTPFTITAQVGLLANPQVLNTAKCIAPNQQLQPSRTVIKFSRQKGKRKTVKAVIKRFKRLDWGGWIRTKAGRHKHLWKKSAARKRRLRQHVFVNSQQATLLDKMVTKYWKRPKHYINDPYTPYHTREELRETRRNPLQY
ncbi:39S ribosomal protein L35, mitochondrial [Toxorhynchites rutilus septentrionalis]|uniref:39S ribosomal protein L35, mitochondrial n=1 Tax=Toxorhynchites rutilus septentrionalis TaxID=329112 RepID=UPI00247AD4A9|nr:39S ribosomal protein L35, mitochondrial [Toxorhynchites rutilus septentrionalis]